MMVNIILILLWNHEKLYKIWVVFDLSFFFLYLMEYQVTSVYSGLRDVMFVGCLDD